MEKFMKVGNLVGGLEVVDVKRVNKLNLIQFLKEVDNYLQEGYRIDVNSARQVGLVLQVDLFKTEEPLSQKVGSTEVGSADVKEEVKGGEVKEDVETDAVASPKVETVTPDEPKETEVSSSVETVEVESKSVEDTVVEPTPVESEKPVKKPTTTRSKKSS